VPLVSLEAMRGFLGPSLVGTVATPREGCSGTQLCKVHFHVVIEQQRSLPTPAVLVAALLGPAAASRRNLGRIAASASRSKGRQQQRSRGFGSGAPSRTRATDTDGVTRTRQTQSRLSHPSDEEVRALGVSVNSALECHGRAMVNGLRHNGWWASDEPVLPPAQRGALRAEVEALWSQGFFQKSQSVRGTEYYDKEHVFATEVDGGKYEVAPRLVHYTVNATRAISSLISEAFPEARLSSQYIGNKLNMCVGQGAAFDPHLDVGVAEKPFNRKLTLLLYLNGPWRPELGGELKLIGEGANAAEVALDSGTAAAGLPTNIAPTAGRWVVFWSDRILHGVNASQAPGGLPDYRVSYTIWLCTEDAGTSAPRAPQVSAPGAGGFETAPDFGRF